MARHDPQIHDCQRDRTAAQKGLSVLKELPEYTAAVKLAKKITAIVATIPESCLWYAWADQTYRATLSILGNIAEAVGRMSEAQTLQYLRIAKGSAYETISYLLTPPPVVNLPEDVIDIAHQIVKNMDRTIATLCDKRLDLLGRS